VPYNREKFIKEVYEETYQLAKDEGIPHDFIMAQVIQETGWGKHILEDTNNIFNIKLNFRT
jgi:flagellum-specific peptidoglycan hydrolase FlgJ